MSADKPPIDREAIRAMVRQVLRDALPEAVREKIAAQAADAAAPQQKKNESRSAESETSKVEDVAITTDAELNVFVRRLLALEPKQREAVQAGRFRFRLKSARKSAETEAARGSERIDKGIVTEKRVMA
ncbi:MAG: hypothetical protein ACREE7_08415, partial [Dongiaceae bacterium]